MQVLATGMAEPISRHGINMIQAGGVKLDRDESSITHIVRRYMYQIKLPISFNAMASHKVWRPWAGQFSILLA